MLPRYTIELGLKILIITPEEEGLGGIQQHITGLVSKLKQRGHDARIVSAKNTVTVPVKGLKNLSFMLGALPNVAFKKYDIIHAHNVPSALPMKYAKGKKVLTIHGTYSEQVRLLHGDSFGNASKKFERQALSWADAITSVSKNAKEYYEKLGFHVTLVPNAVDIKVIPKTEKRLYDKQIVYAGRLSKEKGADILIRAFNLLQESTAHLLIFGDGPDRKKLTELAKGNNHIHFMGYLPRKEVLEYMLGSELLVQPSRREGLSTTLLEAMACKIPIIATKVGGNAELIEHMKTGILVEPADPNELASKMDKVLQDKDPTSHLIENAFAKVISEYEWEEVVSQYLRIYEGILSHP